MANKSNSTKRAGSSVADKGCPCATEEMKRIKKMYDRLKNAGILFRKDLSYKMLTHWLKNTGKSVVWKLDDLRSFDIFIDVERIVKQKINRQITRSIIDIRKSIKDGEEKKYTFFIIKQ